VVPAEATPAPGAGTPTSEPAGRRPSTALIVVMVVVGLMLILFGVCVVGVRISG
jgi:hypothetical protein